MQQQLTPAGQNLVNSVSQRYNLSNDAVIHMLVAVNNGGGTMAQFNCPELGGGGQWMQGGMTLVGDMFNSSLKATVDNVCQDLSNGLAFNQVFPIIPAGTPGSAQWWPANLGVPFSSGSQNYSRYAIFPNRLAVESNGQVTVYDTLDHNIGGVSQQQGGNNSLLFSSQYGTFSVDSLPVISGAALMPPVESNDSYNNNTYNNTSYNNSASYNDVSDNNTSNINTSNGHNPPLNSQSTNEILGLIEGLSKLLQAGVLSQDEFNSKKTDLLNRI